jgi:hypothetical protein
MSSSRMAKTVTVPPVMGLLIRARTLPTTPLAGYSTVALAGTEMTVKVVQAIPAPAVPDSGVVVIVALRFPPVPTSIVTMPPVTGPTAVSLVLQQQQSPACRQSHLEAQCECRRPFQL